MSAKKPLLTFKDIHVEVEGKEQPVTACTEMVADGMVVDSLLKISRLVTDFPEIVELDINPLMVFDEGGGAMAIDMRLVLAPES